MASDRVHFSVRVESNATLCGIALRFGGRAVRASTNKERVNCPACKRELRKREEQS